MSTAVLSTVPDFLSHDHGGASAQSVLKPASGWWSGSSPQAPGPDGGASASTSAAVSQNVSAIELRNLTDQDPAGEPPAPTEDPELRLPPIASLCTMIGTNMLMQFAFFVVVSSASLYSEHLGGTALFSGLTIGIPVVFSGIALIPLAKYDQGQYRFPLKIAYSAVALGSICHGLAYRANFLYLILIGRMITGIGFTNFMYSKRYCSDPRIIGIRRRTTLASWLVLGQGFGFSVGPFIGGVLFKIGFSNAIFNGYTSPGWVTTGLTVLVGSIGLYIFEDVPKPARPPPRASPEAAVIPAHPEDQDFGFNNLTLRQWGIIVTMCWTAMTCFFILGAWEANIPIFTAASPVFHYTPYAAGNFIALGGIATVPFLLLNIRFSRRFQDRTTLAAGSATGSVGILLFMALLASDKVQFAGLYISWFLVALGFNIACTCTMSLLSKQLPNAWNGRTSLFIQYSNYTGRVTGAVLGGAGVQMGMKNYLSVQIAVVGLGALLHAINWKQLKAKTG